jgi:hypothetical protein
MESVDEPGRFAAREKRQRTMIAIGGVRAVPLDRPCAVQVAQQDVAQRSPITVQVTYVYGDGKPKLLDDWFEMTEVVVERFDA